MQAITCPIEGLLLLELNIAKDSCGFTIDRFRADGFAALGLPTNFVQDNQSRSMPGVLRGLHYQTEPQQSMAIGVSRGRIWAVAVDIRPQSATFGQYYGVELTETSGLLFWVPPGFAHGFCVLGDEPADVFTKHTAYDNPAAAGGIRYDDERLAIRWPNSDPKISSRDQGLPYFDEFAINAPRWELPKKGR